METSRIEAVVEFDYVAKEPDELNLKKGNVITDIKIEPGGWWEGTLGGKRGVFPDNFVKVISGNVENVRTSHLNDVTLRSVSGRRCKVLFSYQPVNEDELQLVVDNVIDIISEVEEGWWKGKLGDQVGVFPSNFVEEIEEQPEADTSSSSAANRKSRTSSKDEASESEGELSTSVSSPDSSQLLDGIVKNEQESEAPCLPPKPVKELCRVLYPYEAANEDELTLKEGDIIVILTKEVQDKGWWRGELRGKVGVFPDNFVEVVQQEETKKPDRPPVKLQASTTNRVRDSITKPASPSVSNKDDAIEVTLRKSTEAPRTEDRTSGGPPVVGKKPLLPPPIKKPQRVTNILQMPNSSDKRVADGVDGGFSSKPSKSPNSGSKDEISDFDSVERNSMLTHATRAKAPRRRLPTKFNKDSDSSGGMMNGNAEGHVDHENNTDENEGKEIPTAKGRVWEKVKAPWVEELKLNQARKGSSGPRTSLTPRSTTPSQTGPVTTSRSPEQKVVAPISKSKSEHALSPAGQLKSASPQEKISSEPSEPVAVSKQIISGVTLRHPTGSRPASALCGGSYSQQRPFSIGAPSFSAEFSRFTSDSKSVSSTKPLGINTSLTSTSNPSLLSTSPTAKVDVINVPANTDVDVTHSSNANGGSTVSMKQFQEMKDKVLKLEQSLAKQKELFVQALKDVTDKLNEEVSRRIQLEQDIDKLTNLVTQV